ncbi:uncharacterized protein FFB20_05013 [Fusarium fujikuroi]|nr:uncharacterized protein FFB20_05013 [Fusarium fujikuroi]SCO01298.1 uncharacterized protein FFC1_08868 [Fusarium fujikuroi]SCO05961.1 uncharacterized protein FFE2_10900 [Fusarium fujikuroi]SCO10200.1 uncharacterized protein FFM5_09757 [Fusarium fujikuroi]SCO47168.1 uncharacterized protein FFNC_11234 [Fusarium fujikuroi]
MANPLLGEVIRSRDAFMLGCHSHLLLGTTGCGRAFGSDTPSHSAGTPTTNDETPIIQPYTSELSP